MCNLYSQTKSQDAMRRVFVDMLEDEIEDVTGNLPSQPGIYPDYPTPIRTEWTSVRKLKEGEMTAELFGFLTCPANAEVGAVHPKAMPVILTEPEEYRRWLTAPVEEVLRLQRPLPDGRPQIVAVGAREDAA